MKLIRFYICAAVFILLTAIRLTLPTVSGDISRAIDHTLSMEQRQTAELISYGKKLSKTDPADLPAETEAPEPYETEAPQTLQILIPEPEPVPEYAGKVEAFLESQAEYSEYAVPFDVTYEVPEIPFDYACPVDGISSSGFGYRLHPIQNEVRFHYGTDFAADSGEPVRAFADGTVIAAGLSDSYGNYVVISHPEGYRTLYAHCSELCTDCREVKMGEVIALVGQTGAATGPHLHFELMQGNTYLNPEFYL